jgi:two-component system osmolarity sensor histidine kinase EnvZ
MKYFLNHPFKALKAYLPKSMFGRSLLILVVPLVFIETISAYVFLDYHWDRITQSLAQNIAGEVATVMALYNENPSEGALYRSLAAVHLKLRTEFFPKETIQSSVPEELRDSVLDNALKNQIITPYTFNIENNDILIKAEVRDGILQFSTPLKRLFSKSFFLFILWAAGTSAFFLLIAVAFMHNQVKPLRRLAIAADRFGKGRSFRNFRPEGAIEIRKVTQAFMTMKERLQRQLTQKTEMLAGVSHDLRTPLTRMRLQLAMMAPSPEVDGLQKDIEEMTQMLEGYLAFARGEGREETHETNITDLLSETIADRADLQTVVHYTPHLLPHLLVKPQALKRCLMNLINNAARYGHEVWVQTVTTEEHLVISIEDDGPGVPEDKLEEVFKPFFRLDFSRNVATGGVGLGLAIARDIAQSHGGNITLSSSSKHGGLKASLTLPH